MKSNKKKQKKKVVRKKKVTKAIKTYGGGLSLVPVPFKTQQLLQIAQRTPESHIYTRPAKGGGEWEFVTGVYFKKILNYIFGYMWDFQVIDKGREGDQVWVQGRLTIKNRAGKPMIIKEQFGRADIKFKKGQPHKPEFMLDYGNDLKAASTDGLKKCASELGIASDIYGKNEFRDIQKVDKGFKPPKIETTKPEKVVEEAEVREVGEKVKELREMLKGKTDPEKIKDLHKRTGIKLNDFDISNTHAGVLVASLLHAEVKK